MTTIDFNETRYSICIGLELANGNVKFIRIADYNPDSTEEDGELVPPVYASDACELEERYAYPSYIRCWDAFHDYPVRDSDIYALEWHIDEHDYGNQIACEWRDDGGRPMSDSVREVVTIPGVLNREDLVNALSRGYWLGGITTRQFYLVYEYPSGGYMRYAIKCKRDDFVDRSGFIRLADSVSNVRQSILTAPIVVLDEEKIIRADIGDLPDRELISDFGGQDREIYSDLKELDEEEGRLLLRPFDYCAADYVRYYLKHCKTSTRLTDKERRYAVAQEIDEALSHPEEISEYLEGAEYPEDEVSRLKKAIAAQMENSDDESLALVQDALMENEAIREKCISLAERRGSAKLDVLHRELEELEAKAKEAKLANSELEKKVTSLTEKASSLRREIETAENRIDELSNAEKRMTRELEDNLALRLGFKSISRSMTGISDIAKPTTPISLAVSEGLLTNCDHSNGDLAGLVAGNLKKLGVTSSSSSRLNIRAISVGVSSCVALGVPMAMQEPAATVLAAALAAALYSAEPTRVVVPADYRDIATVIKTVENPGVYIIEGVIDSVNEGVLFSMLRKREASTVIFSFRSHASALLLARETWDGLFMPSVEALNWAPFLSRNKSLSTMDNNRVVKLPRGMGVTDKAEELSQSLRPLGLPTSAFILPAAISLISEDEYGESSYEPIIAQHLAVACGGRQEALETLNDWVGVNDSESGLAELSLRIGAARGQD